MEMSLIFWELGHKTNYWTKWKFDVVMIPYDPLREPQIITHNKHDQIIASSWNISVKTTNVKLMVALKEQRSRDHEKSLVATLGEPCVFYFF